MQIIDSEPEGTPHIRMEDQIKLGSESSRGKCIEPTDDDIIHDDAETNILDQSQDVANLLSSQNALAAAAAAAAVVASSVSTDRMTPDMQDARLKLSSAAVAHINGTMQKMLSFQNLQNLASLQQQKMSFVGLGGLASTQACLNSPLNLSLASSSHTDPSQLNASCSPSITSPELTKNLCGSKSENYSPQMPQLILASGGQLMQGVQVAQLLIPTPQGISTQTILTIPVSQQVNSNEQLAQTLAALKNCPTNQQVQQHQKQQSSHQMPNLLASPTLHGQSPKSQKSQQGPSNANLFSSSVQELLTAIQPNLFDLHEQHSTHHHRRHSMSTNSPSPNFMQTCANESSNIRTHTPKHSPIRNFENREVISSQSVSTVVSGSSGTSQHQHPIMPSTSPLSQFTTNGEVQKFRSSTPPQNLSNPQTQHREGNDVPIAFNSNDNNNNNNSDRSIASNSSVIGNCSSNVNSGNSISHIREHSHSPNIAINSINRLTTSNGELTITKSQGLPPPPQSSTNSTNSKSTHSHSHHSSHRMLSHHKNHLSHHQSSSMVTTPPVTETVDDESPNEPTINQTNCNVVDGIDLDEIKEFAKAFKLRRLSLGLTQTQVGQALSVIEGPAYSQSAICRFEKLDITPKSAQKIKPVLERWMKEAEERHWNHYKSGQSHLTDFIGVEPSKKRKRRTSFTPQALELLNAHFERNTHPSGTEITGLAHQLGYEREVIRIWFCNKRQALKNTVRMMSKGMV